ncbi:MULTISPECIES: WhiB family transcriptional regulator [Streptomyces]|uniref:WhiB family transcriptional regulator n=1 Tax=Streptomyces lycopersici TaxID=2974589 RepID=UPI0021CE8BE9|nr:WhiB family transcriptional regulator [Streptomyces sp. NEAU-383]
MRWDLNAACRGEKTESFFLLHPLLEKAAKDLCSTCPVQAQCLDLAMQTEGGSSAEMRFGVFGGLNPEERAALEKARRPKAKAPA